MEGKNLGNTWTVVSLKEITQTAIDYSIKTNNTNAITNSLNIKNKHKKNMNIS